MSCRIREVKVDGVPYRGPMPTHVAAWPYKITAFLPSDKRSTADRPVGASWQTWRKFRTLAECNVAMQALANVEGSDHAHRGDPC